MNLIGMTVGNAIEQLNKAKIDYLIFPVKQPDWNKHLEGSGVMLYANDKSIVTQVYWRGIDAETLQPLPKEASGLDIYAEDDEC